MSKLKLGLNKCTNQEYHADKTYLSSSVIKAIAKSLETYHHEYILGNRKEPSNKAALEEGSYAHTMILEPHLLDVEYHYFDGIKAGKKFEQAQIDAAGRTIISYNQKTRLDNLLKAYNARPEAVELIKGGEAEQTICAQLVVDDEVVNIKVRFDYINVDKGYIADIKTTGYSGDLDAFKMTCSDLNYPLSASLYCQIAEQFYNKPFKFYFIVLSKRDITCDVYLTSDKTMNEGKQTIHSALKKYVHARRTNVWTEHTPDDIIEPITDYEIQEI